VFENDLVLSIASNLARESFDLSGERRTWDEAGGQAMLVGVAAGSCLPARERGPMLLPALRRLAAICRSVTMAQANALLDDCRIRRTGSALMIRSDTSRTWSAKLAR
jgi:hypothetical protein